MHRFILGINSTYHDTAACIVDSETGLLCASEEERYTRIRHAKTSDVFNPDAVPWHSIRRCLNQAGLVSNDITDIAISIAPGARLPNQSIEEPKTPGCWGTNVGERMFAERVRSIPDQLACFGFRNASIHWIGHHLAHAFSALQVADFRDAAALVVDGIGEVNSAAAFNWRGGAIEPVATVSHPNSLGFVWEKMSKFLGFSEYDACKVMGLAAYGDPERYRKRMHQILRADNSSVDFHVDNEVFAFRVDNYRKLESHFNVTRRPAGSQMSSDYQDIAAALQNATCDTLLSISQKLREITGAGALCYAGGVALNCAANKEMAFKSGFESIFVPPAPNDAGTCIGAAFAASNRMGLTVPSGRKDAFLGPSFSEQEIASAVDGCGFKVEHRDEIEAEVARSVADGQVVARFDGEMEFGPRALGNRSFFADPRGIETRHQINRKVKHREEFRPFGATLLASEVDDWFEVPRQCEIDTGTMLYALEAKPSVRNRIPAVIHKDGSCRIQSVCEASNLSLYRIVSHFRELTGVPMVLNTSFNRTEPIVCTPADAVRTFAVADIDCLAIGPFMVRKVPYST